VLSDSLGSILVPGIQRRCLGRLFEKSTMLVYIGWSGPCDPNTQCALHFMMNPSRQLLAG